MIGIYLQSFIYTALLKLLNNGLLASNTPQGSIPVLVVSNSFVKEWDHGTEWIFSQFSVTLSYKKHTINWRDRTAIQNDLVQFVEMV